MAFQQPELPYALDALKPFLSEEQMHYHYNKHHAAYFAKLNGLVEGKPEADKPLVELVKSSGGAVFNNAAQAWNHTFFWQSMSPKGGGEPSGQMADLLHRDFGGLDSFKKAFADAAVGQFGSGWAWLVRNGAGKLEIVATSNAGNPLCDGKTPLLTVDVWEHAYYVDYRNERPRFVDGFWSVVDWEFAARCLAEGA